MCLKAQLRRRSHRHISPTAHGPRLPVSEVQDQASTEQVSIEAEEILDDGDHLKILIEKDFACLAPREDEDESDMYSHPLAARDQEK